MIFKILISIVFIAELIIASSLLIFLIKFDKKINEYNDFIDDVKPSIKGLMILIRKISKQLIEFAPIIVNNLKSFILNLFIGQIKSALGALTFWLVKKEVERHI